MDDELEWSVQGTLRMAAAVPTRSGDVLVAATDNQGNVWVWSLGTGALVTGPVGVGTALWNMEVVHLDGGRPCLAMCDRRFVTVWDMDTFGPEATPVVRCAVDSAMSMAVVPAAENHGELLVTGEKDLVRVVDPQDGGTVATIRWPSRAGDPIGRRVYRLRGVRFADGSAGFAGEVGFEQTAWSVARRKLVPSRVKLTPRKADRQLFDRLTYFPPEGPRQVVAAGKAIEVWDPQRGQRLAVGELNGEVGPLTLVSWAWHTLVAASVASGAEVGVLLWDPATRQPVTDVVNRHPAETGDAGEEDDTALVTFSGMTIGQIITLTDPTGAPRIAIVSDNSGQGTVRVSPPVADLLARGTAG
ncbi:hypothetical protein ACWEOE_17735 [Amycolatopsis sp. NPDC004368]